MSDTLFDRALDWIDRHLEEFDPLWKPDQFDFNRGQRLGELAILVRTLAGTGLAGDPRLRRMTDLLKRSQSSPVYRDRVLRSPIEFMLFVETYATLRSVGLDDEPMRARIQKAIRAGWLDQTERFPHREMDIRSCLDSCGIECDSPPLDELYRRSILGASPNPILLGEHDLYALTHVVMFVCDFGARPPHAMPASQREGASDLLSALSVVAAQDGHWDLLAEFLLCWSCLELPESGLVRKAWKALAHAQLDDGAVPGPEAKGSVLLFDHVYHTTLVSALAAGVRRHKAAAGPGHLRGVAQRGDPHEVRLETESKDVAQRAAGWLTRAAEAELGQNVPSALRLGQILVGLWACSGLAEDAPPIALLSRIARRLSDAASSAEWRALPPLLRCVSAAWSARSGLVVPALHGEDGFLRRASAVFEVASAEAGRPVLELSEVWTTLHQLGMAPAVPAISEADVVSQATMEIDGDGGRLDDLLRLIEASTASGTRNPGWTGEGAWLPQLIAGLCVDACRRYDLLKASNLLRAGLWISAEDPCARRILRLCARYLMFNQREDGAFGLLGPELATRREKLGSAADDDDCLLPLTVSGVLALAECFTEWRLLGQLGTLAPAVNAAVARGSRARAAPVHPSLAG